MGIVLAILLFGFIVFFHELGHFLLARINGINVYEFWIGMEGSPRCGICLQHMVYARI